MPRLTLDLSNDVSNELNEIAEKNGISKSEALRRAFALLSVVEREKKKGRSLGIIAEDANHQMKVVAKVIGI